MNPQGPHPGALPKGPTGSGLLWNPVLKMTLYKGESWPPGEASRKSKAQQDPQLK